MKTIEGEIKKVQLEEEKNKKQILADSQVPEIRIETPVKDNTELQSTLKAVQQERDGLKVRVDETKANLKAETTKLLQQVTKATQQRDNLKNSVSVISSLTTIDPVFSDKVSAAKLTMSPQKWRVMST